MLMDCITFFKHLTLDNEIGCGFLVLGCIKHESEKLGMFLFFAFVFKLLYSGSFSRVLIDFICNSRGKSGEFKNGFCSKSVVDGKYGLNDEIEERIEKSRFDADSVGEVNTDHDEELDANEKECTEEEDDEFNVLELRKLVNIERRRANAAFEELEKERAASATATKEAMAMILRLQNEMSLIKMESDQFRRLAEEKQIHDQEVIQSLQWLMWRLESEMSLLEEQLRSDERDEVKEVDEALSCFNGTILDDLENEFHNS